MKQASAYQRKDRIILSAVSTTTDGVGITADPILSVTATDVSGLGEATLAALEGSRVNVPNPAQWEWGLLFEPVLRAAGVKSWSTFSKSARNVAIRFDANQVILIPTKNLGPKEGLVALPNKERSSSPTRDELGRSLIAAFKDAE